MVGKQLKDRLVSPGRKSRQVGIVRIVKAKETIVGLFEAKKLM